MKPKASSELDAVIEDDISTEFPDARQLSGPKGWAFWTGSRWRLFDKADKLLGFTDASSDELHEERARMWCAAGV